MIPRLRFVTVSLAVALLAGAARAEPTAATAEHLFEEGRSLMAAGRYGDACPKLAESHRLDPGVGTLLNLGDCYEKLGKTASAWATYREAETMAHRLGQKGRASHAAGRAETLKKELAYLVIDVPSSTPGLVVQRDGEPAPRAVWATRVPIDPGEHTIEANAPGYLPLSRKVNIAPRGEVKVSIPDLAPEPEKPKDETNDSGAANTGRTQRIVGWSAAGTGIAVVGAGLVFGAIASSKNDEARNDHCSAIDCTPRGASLISDAQSAATISTVLVIVGAALAAGGVALVFTAPKPPAKEASRGYLLGGTF